ncbi:nickel ABC transporter permease subunit NikC [Salibacterium salarium]|uniref:Nickel ABC transporter permease subunit NikC n=1 Tax=Salibacterium salarium TaxID=284579 RepID=A0A3R9QKG4_9BACI|nr:nickel ABC transporter permease subunit NikC [Salibacterium salarium]RSL32361.1 nickel ABC transporter permease subunit NikC [Salibacterium salarium]
MIVEWCKQIFKYKLLMFSGTFIILIAVIAIFAPYFAPHDPNLTRLELRLQGPSKDFLLGTDHQGRDILSRLIYGARVSMGSSILVVVVTMIISIVIGTFSGYKGGRIDYIFMRFCDIIMAFPGLVLILAFIGIMGPGLFNLILAMILIQWVSYARIIRGMVMSYKEQQFVSAARMLGSSNFKIIIRHLLPGIIPQIAVLASLDMGTILLHIAGFSFLGLGIQPPTPEWGAMLNDSRQFLRSHPSLMFYPGMMIFVIVMSFNLLGDALRDLMEQK